MNKTLSESSSHEIPKASVFPIQHNFFLPSHQAEVEKMHASQIEETDELIVCDQLHEQPAVSSFQKTPMIQYTKLSDKINTKQLLIKIDH